MQVDLDLRDFYTESFPAQTASGVAFVEDYNEFRQVEHSDFGETRYTSVTFSGHPLVIAAFAISGVVGLVGAVFCVFLAGLVLRGFRVQY